MADASRLALQQLVNRTRQPSLPGFLDPAESSRLQVATVSKVDAGRNEVSVILNDYNDPEIHHVPVLGDGTNLPSVGDLVQVEYVGKTLQVVSRQYRPAGSVSFA